MSTDSSKNERLLKVAANTDANKLAGSICSAYEENENVSLTLRSIGAGSLNQAMKAVIVSNRMFSKKGKVAVFLPYFKDIPTDDNKNITAIELKFFLKDI